MSIPPLNHPPAHPLRAVKSLADRAAELESQEQAVAARIREQQEVLCELAIQRCAIAYEQRRGIASTLQKKATIASDWQTLLSTAAPDRRPLQKARKKALGELHLHRAWVAWNSFPQILVAFELSKENVGELFWVRDGVKEILPHLLCALPGKKCLGISHSGMYSVKLFLLCAEAGDHFEIVEAYREDGDVVLFDSPTLQGALEFVQRNYAR